MKIKLLLCMNILIISLFSLIHCQSIYYQDIRNANISSWDNFYAQTYKLPQLLEIHKKEKNNPLVIITHEISDIASPLDDKAILLEGTRVAHTWASIYFKFYGSNIRILQIPQGISISSDELKNYIQTLGSLVIENDPTLNLEEQIEHRIFNLKQLKPSAFS